MSVLIRVVSLMDNKQHRGDNLENSGSGNDREEKAREINDGNGFGQHGELLSLANSEIGDWSYLTDKCIMIPPVAEGFERRLGAGGGGDS